MELFILVNEPKLGEYTLICSDGLTNLDVLTCGRTYWYLNMDRPK